MRVCIIGAGISGLSAAHYLSGCAGVEVTVVERSTVPGGRANVEDGAEHCPRVFLNDYSYLFDILRAIPATGGGTLFGSLKPLRRMVRLSIGWIEVSHLYRALAREVPWRERIRQAIASRRVRLVAEQAYGPNTNRYGSLRNYALPSLLRLLSNLFKSKTGLTLDGPTDECLILPWVRHLRSLGVTIRTGAPVESMRQTERGVELTIAGKVELFDATVVTAFRPDARRLLDASGADHTLDDGQHVHCKALTIKLNRAEPVLQASGPAIYCHAGVNLVLQPRHHRCVVLCTWSASTDEAFVLATVREFLALEYPFEAVSVRDNQLPREGVYAADYVSPHGILRQPHDRVFFAGSYVENSYPLDSGEGAARSAFNAVDRLRSAYGLRSREAEVQAVAR